MEGFYTQYTSVRSSIQKVWLSPFSYPLPSHRLANAAVAKRWLFLGFQYLLFLAVNHLHHCLSNGFQHVLVDVVDVVGNGVPCGSE